MKSLPAIKKAFGMPTSDTGHVYIYKSGEYGPMYQYWYRDVLGNYFKYTNAPADSPEYDVFLGQPLLDPEQPLPEKNPEFFTEEGLKRSLSIPEGVEPTRNPFYNQKDLYNIWFEAYQDVDKTKYIYLDADIKENLDIYVQHQLRVVDSSLTKFRQYATELFTGSHSKDRITGAMLMLVDQGFYEVEELINATVGDIQFVDQTVILLGRKFLCDINFYDFLTSIVLGRTPVDPLFVFDTMHGQVPVGVNYTYAVFSALKVSPKFLLCWNASHIFSRIMNRMALQGIEITEVETAALDELARMLSTRDDVQYLVDHKVKATLLRNYTQTVSKGLIHLVTDDFGVTIIRSDLTSFRQDEQEFSEWLQSTPLHDSSPAEEAAVEQVVNTQPLDTSPDEEPKEQEQPEPPPAPATEVPE